MVAVAEPVWGQPLWWWVGSDLCAVAHLVTQRVGDVQAVFEVFRNGNFFLALQLRVKLQLALAAIAPHSIPQPLPAAADLKRYALIVVNEERCPAHSQQLCMARAYVWTPACEWTYVLERPQCARLSLA